MHNGRGHERADYVADPHAPSSTSTFSRTAICSPPTRRAEPFYLLGSDGLGRDLYSRIVYGSRVSMCVGLIGVLISFSLGITVGALSGYVGGRSTI